MVVMVNWNAGDHLGGEFIEGMLLVVSYGGGDVSDGYSKYI